MTSDFSIPTGRRMRPFSEAENAEFRSVRFVLTDMDETLTHHGRLSAALWRSGHFLDLRSDTSEVKSRDFHQVESRKMEDRGSNPIKTGNAQRLIA
ncbi:hypothetical protein B5P46_26695 [Rhizobium leguminosarum]|uniref:HAD family hydrolase n=1 Tax=Rhizobium leguminosarum TaxID=384 RepID=A0A4V1P0A8_RHILE|nr:hypothetical protein B5P46_26695 [Rhizobium leguminosarum]